MIRAVVVSTLFAIFVDFPTAAVTIRVGLAHDRGLVERIFLRTIARIIIVCNRGVGATRCSNKKC